MLHAETRRLAAIMFTDIVGFSRQMGANEARMLRLLEVHNRIIQHAVTEYHGHVIKIMGDAFLVDFPSRSRRSVRPTSSRPIPHSQCGQGQPRADSHPHRHSLGRYRTTRWRCVWRWGQHCLAPASPGRA